MSKDGWLGDRRMSSRQRRVQRRRALLDVIHWRQSQCSDNRTPEGAANRGTTQYAIACGLRKQTRSSYEGQSEPVTSTMLYIVYCVGSILENFATSDDSAKRHADTLLQSQ